MIKRITMKNCATYDKPGVVIDDCDRVNFIYGHNGSGKSTISNYLGDPQEYKFNNCSIVSVFPHSSTVDCLRLFVACLFYVQRNMGALT